MRPSDGVVVLGDGTRHRVENTDGLRDWALGLAVFYGRKSGWSKFTPYNLGGL